jgi:hypothetical protein
MKKINNNKHTVDEPQHLWLRHFSAGVCAGGTSRTCTAPLDRLRTFFQGKIFFFFFFEDYILYLFDSLWSRYTGKNDYTNDIKFNG